MAASADSAASSGMMESIRSFLASWIAVVKTRIEIISVEIEEQREWIEQLLLLAVAAAFCLSMGMILLTLFVVVLFWESHPLIVLGGFTILYLGGGIALWLTLRHKVRTKPRIFSATSTELGKDYASLQPRAP